MAEQVLRERESQDCEERKEVKEDDSETEELDGEKKQQVETIPDCSVCLQTCTYPVKLACGHIFCFLCIKGVAFRSRRCALCRQDVDLKYFDNPEVVDFKAKSSNNEGQEDTSESVDGYQWYYEGRNGWWQYEESSSAELEKAQKDGKRSCELLIAGFLYFVDFENMVQFRKTEPGRRRRIKRDVIDAEKKGVAGLRLQGAANQRSNVAQNVSNSTRNDSSTSSDPSTVDLTNIERLVVGSSSDDGDDSGGGDSGDQVQQQTNGNSS